jgi:hypothetical protein
MTTQNHDRLSQLYTELNQDHTAQRESLLQGLMTTDTAIARLQVAQYEQHARHVSRRWLLGVSGIAAAVIVASLFLWRPQNVLAEVQKALRSKEWIHLVVSRLDGSQCETWESPSGQMSASISPEEIRFVDKSNAIEHVYDFAQKKLTRLELDERQHPDTMQMLIDLLLGDANSTSWLKVAQRQQHTVTENGETWDEVTLVTEPIGGQALTWICKIDPETHLPISYRTQVPTGRNFQLGWVEGKFDYPSKGPLAIAELGIPTDAPLDDRVPKDSLKHILSSMKLARQKLGAYHLKLFYSDGPQLCRECWKDGSKWRQDHEVPEVCDGRQLWMKTLSGWQLQEFRRFKAGWPYIEDMTYPQLSATMDFELKLRSDQAEGPEGCILVEKVAAANANQFVVHRFTPRREQFWLDANRDYALVKYVRTDVQASEAECRARQSSKHSEFHYSDFERSPRGVWYPMSIKSIGTVAQGTDPMVEVPDGISWALEVEFAESYASELFDIDAAKKRSP